MTKVTPRRTFLKQGALALGTLAVGELAVGCGGAARSSGEPDTPDTPATPTPGGRSKVYFTRDISVPGLLAVYARISEGLTGSVAIKLHTGEPNGPNLLPIDLIRGLQAQIAGSTIVECNVLYSSPRQTTAGHRQVLLTNGFDFCTVDILDEEGDASLPIPGGRRLARVSVGSHLLDYDSLLVYTHFKGHTMGGFGGSLKNIGIGCASGIGGKAEVHGAGFGRGAEFLERMVESGKGTASHFGVRMACINVLKNISVDCDCDARGAPPTCPDIGIMGSTDILAVDQASIDQVYALPQDQRAAMVERIESRGGLHQLEYMDTMQMGNRAYDIVEV